MYCKWIIEGKSFDLCKGELPEKYASKRFLPAGHFQLLPTGKNIWIPRRHFKSRLEETDVRREIISYLRGDYTDKDVSLGEAQKILQDANLLNCQELNDLGEYLGCWHLKWDQALEAVMAHAYERAYKRCGATEYREFNKSYARFKKLSLHNKKLTCAIMERGFNPERAMDDMWKWSVYVGDGVFYVAPRLSLEVIK